MATKFYNLDVDTTLGGNSPSDNIVPSQKAIKTYVDNQGGGGASTLAGLTDVAISSATSGQALVYNSTSTKWENQSLSGYQTTSNLVTSVSASSTDAQYPSAKLFYDTCGDIETLINAL